MAPEEILQDSSVRIRWPGNGNEANWHKIGIQFTSNIPNPNPKQGSATQN